MEHLLTEIVKQVEAKTDVKDKVTTLSSALSAAGFIFVDNTWPLNSKASRAVRNYMPTQTCDPSTPF